MSDVIPAPINCAVCGEDHIEDEATLARCTRIGISFVHPDCQWAIRYPGKTANEVIEMLEARVAARPEPRIDLPAPSVAGPAAPPTEDPAERDGGEFTQEKLCPVCNGDGEVPEDDGGTLECGRCAGSGRIVVAPG